MFLPPFPRPGGNPPPPPHTHTPFAIPSPSINPHPIIHLFPLPSIKCAEVHATCDDHFNPANSKTVRAQNDPLHLRAQDDTSTTAQAELVHRGDEAAVRSVKRSVEAAAEAAATRASEREHVLARHNQEIAKIKQQYIEKLAVGLPMSNTSYQYNESGTLGLKLGANRSGNTSSTNRALLFLEEAGEKAPEGKAPEGKATEGKAEDTSGKAGAPEGKAVEGKAVEGKTGVSRQFGETGPKYKKYTGQQCVGAVGGQLPVMSVAGSTAEQCEAKCNSMGDACGEWEKDSDRKEYPLGRNDMRE